MMQKPEPRVGSWRRFGALGPAYEIIAIEGLTPDGTDRVLRIRLPETGEEVAYTLKRAMDDELVADKAH